jgi:hypothetical protein
MSLNIRESHDLDMPCFLWGDWALETGRVFEIDHPEHGRSREAGHCLRMSGTPLLNKGPSARLGQHTREILLELGYSSEEPSSPTRNDRCDQQHAPGRDGVGVALVGNIQAGTPVDC